MDAFGKVLVAASLGVGGYLGYTEIYKPYVAQKKLEAEAAALAAKTGMPLQQALAQVGGLACKGATAAFGVPPSPITNAACDLAGNVVGLAIVKGGPLAIKGLKSATHATVSAAKGVGHAGVAVVKAPVKLVTSVASKLKFWGIEGIHC